MTLTEQTRLLALPDRLKAVAWEAGEEATETLRSISKPAWRKIRKGKALLAEAGEIIQKAMDGPGAIK